MGGFIVLLGDLSFHSGTRRGMIVRSGLTDLNLSNVLLSDFYAHFGLSIKQIMFEHKGVHQCTRHWHTLGNRSMIHFDLI